MRNLKKTATAVGAAALVLFGGLAAVQQQAPPKIDADSLATQLGLSSKEKAQVAPHIDQLNQLLAQRDRMRREHQQLWTKLHDVQQKIAGVLTPEQQRGFGQALGRAYGSQGYGWGGMGMRARGMGYGRMGSGAMGPGRMGGRHMGYGQMGRGGMMQGRGGGWMRGPGAGMRGAGMAAGVCPRGLSVPQGPGSGQSDGQ